MTVDKPSIEDILVFDEGSVWIPPEKLSEIREWPRMYKTIEGILKR